jgi:histidinol-phosphate/aromatic aminotransferase/cobyric acid decarboxylase-like protein/GTP:adenosylcobinamide-phosphate guanylyltransferase
VAIGGPRRTVDAVRELNVQAVILAAGLGRRLGALTRHSTKFMVPINGRPLGAYTLEALAAARVSRIVLVVGHGATEVRDYVGTRIHGIPVTYIHNEAYEQTNNVFSLLLAADALSADDSLVLESDVLFEPSIVADCVASSTPNLAVVARYESWMDGTVALLGPAGDVARLVPKTEFCWTDRDRYFKTVNIYRFSASFSRDYLVPHLSRYVVEQGSNAFYEQVLEALLATSEIQLAALDVGSRRWYEVDDVQDLDIAETLFADDDERPRRLARRFGGYWRFGQLIDFAYLVNPYFPPEMLMEEIASDLPRLAGSYPSGQLVQRQLMGRLFGCDARLLLVGNGASELIRVLLPALDGTLGIVRPTFEEYPRLIPRVRLAELSPSGPHFRYTVGELLAFARDQQLATLVLVNPDNPTGHYLPFDDVCALAVQLHQMETRLIVDESFVDFVDGSLDHTLLRDDILQQHPNLVVLRSLGKSHGVAGLRLGVLATADTQLRRELEDRLPIWNVNAVAEAFLQRAPRYRAEYAAACRQVVEERERLFAGVRGIAWLRPIPSAGNFILCEVLGGISAQAVVRDLLAQASILAKDCSGKPGLGDGQYLRLAGRDAADNARLLAGLSAFHHTRGRAVSMAGRP